MFFTSPTARGFLCALFPRGPASLVILGQSSEEDFADDTVLLTASDAEDWVNSVKNSVPLPHREPSDARTSLVSELKLVLIKDVEELSL